LSWRNTTGLFFICTRFSSKIFNKFLVIFLKITFPNHYNRISTSCSKIISTWRKCWRKWRSFMSI
jgi:hypothetical protein